MRLKPALITLSIMIGVGAMFFISVAGKPLIAWILIGFIGGFCFLFIFMEIYEAITCGTADGQFP